MTDERLPEIASLGQAFLSFSKELCDGAVLKSHLSQQKVAFEETLILAEFVRGVRAIGAIFVDFGQALLRDVSGFALE